MATNAVPIRPDFELQLHATSSTPSSCYVFSPGSTSLATATSERSPAAISQASRNPCRSPWRRHHSPELTLIAGYIIPIVELLIGACLLLGIFTRAAITAAFVLLFVLMFGVTMKQDWNAAGQQIVYGLVLFILLFIYDRYDVSWPNLFRRSHTITPAPSVQ